MATGCTAPHTQKKTRVFNSLSYICLLSNPMGKTSLPVAMPTMKAFSLCILNAWMPPLEHLFYPDVLISGTSMLESPDHFLPKKVFFFLY